MTAAGLWTSATDMARYCLEMERSLDGKANNVLTERMTKEMVTAGKGDWGWGCRLAGRRPIPTLRMEEDRMPGSKATLSRMSFPAHCRHGPL